MFLAQFAPDYGAAIQKAVSVAALAVFGGVTFTYLAHCFFAIAEGTASGQEPMVWPDEPMVDRLSKSLWLAWIMLLTASPTYILGPAIFGHRAAGWFVAAVGIGFLFPIIALSLQTGQSPGSVIHLDTVRRLFRRMDYLLGYYGSVAVAYVIIGAGMYLMFGRSSGLLPVGAVVTAAGIMIAARLYGRLAHLVSHVKLGEKKQAAPRRTIRLDEAAYVAANRPSRTTRGTGEAYGMRSATAPEPEREVARPTHKRIWVEEGADEPYAFAANEPATPPKQQLPAALLQPSEYEMALAVGNRPVKPPDYPWIRGTFTFPLQPTCWQPMVMLAAGLTVSGIFIRVLIG